MNRLVFIVLLMLLSQAWAQEGEPAGPKWRQEYLGIVTALGDGRLDLQVRGSEQILTFFIAPDISVTPSEWAVKVGFPVRLVANRRQMKSIRVLTVSEWLELPPADAKSR